jgi:hypothetical protein
MPTGLPTLMNRMESWTSDGGAGADHLARLLDKLGLDRVPQKVPDLTAYLAAKYPGASPEPTDDTAARSAHMVRTPVKEA